MKSILVISVLCLTLANAFLFRVPSPTVPTFNEAPSSISEYFTAFFAHFELEQPNQIIKCFDEKYTALYFKHLDEVNNLVQSAEKREKVKVHLIWAKLFALHKVLEPLGGCIAATQDFSDLLKALGAEERNPKLFMLAKYIYYQANFGKLAQEMPKVVGAINNKDWKSAGDFAATVVENMANELKNQGLALHGLNALWNGVHIGLDLPDAQSVWGCWDKDTAKIRLEFIYGMAKAVADGKWNEAAVNTEKWYEEKGNELLRQIPEANWKCWGDSSDTKAESEKLGVDLTSREFHEKVNNFVHKYQAAYWHLQKNIRKGFEEHNFLHAGDDYAHLMKAAVSAK